LWGNDKLVGAISELIRENWGKIGLEKIEKRLFERHELSLEHCLFEFEKVDEVIREFVGYRVDGLEQRFLETWSRK
jgi:hypothetical protein